MQPCNLKFTQNLPRCDREESSESEIKKKKKVQELFIYSSSQFEYSRKVTGVNKYIIKSYVAYIKSDTQC